MNAPVRVFQVATGNVGSEMIKRIGNRADLEIVGLHCYSPDKIGRDAGEIVGLPTIGVKATGTVEEINAAFRDDPFSLKAEHYRAQNLLAKSLHPLCYERNPSFRRFMLRHGLTELFRPYPHTFGITSITERQRLYRALCECIWDLGRLGLVLPDPAPD